MKDREFCPCDNKPCDSRYGGWCYGNLCSEAIEENEKLDNYTQEILDRYGTGLHVKYNVTKIEDGSIVNDCFVLRPQKDKTAINALLAYADSTDNKQLADDIIEWINELNNLIED